MKVEKNSEEVIQYLDQIAENLCNHRASVLVGAGFSKNAESQGEEHRKLPDWKELGDVFYEQLYGKKPDDTVRYVSALKLAEEVKAVFKRPKLDALLREYTSDASFVPSELHRLLLELPWEDVFTTNYDTLLERAQKDVIDRYYTPVCCKNDILSARHPWIVKLHGPFASSDNPYIITEEDYRTYPTEYAPFVNSVRQTLLEKTLCLIGFSADDPNFLNWIGWIRDNLGEYSNSIYFVTVPDVPEAQKKVFEKRNIIVVTLSKFFDISETDYNTGLKKFFISLSDKIEENNKQVWAPRYARRYQEDLFHRSVKDVDTATILNHWVEQRGAYPGWIVLPEDQRRILWLYTDSWTQISCDGKEYIFQLTWSDELLWRMEKCLMPLFSDQIPVLEKLTDTFFKSFRSDKTFCDPAVIQKTVHICIALLKSYREDGNKEKYNTLKNRLDTIFDYIEPEQKMQIYYERCLSGLFAFDSKKIDDALKSWQVNTEFPFWEAKRAGLLAELGKVKDAFDIVKTSLSGIRSLLKNTPENYKLLSQESYCIKLYMILKRVNSDKSDQTDASEFEVAQIKSKHLEYYIHKQKVQKTEKIDQAVETQQSEDFADKQIYGAQNTIDWNNFQNDFNDLYKKRNEERKDEWIRYLIAIRSEADKNEGILLGRRQTVLISYKCDPDSEIQFFASNINNTASVKAESESYTFDIGEKLIVEDFRKNDDYYLPAYQFFNFLETSGLPVRVPSLILSTTKAAKESIKRLADISSSMVSFFLVRLNDVKLIENLYPRSVVSGMSVERVDTTIRTYLSLLKNVRTSIAEADNTSSNYLDSALSGMISELLSRFVTKCSTPVRDETLDWVLSVYTTEDWRKYQNLQVVLMRLLKSYSAQELYERIPKLLLLPLPDNPSLSDESRLYNPFLFMNFTGKHVQRKPAPVLLQDTINHLQAQVSSDRNYVRNWAVTTIYRLAGLGLLSASQKKEYGTALWSKRDSDGFPKGTDFYHFAFLLMPHPKDVQPEEVFLKYMEKSTFPIRGDADGYEVTDGNIPVCHNILGAGESIDFSIDEIRLLLQKITSWWQADKKYIQSPYDDGARQEFRLRFAEMIEVLSRVVVAVVAAEGTQAQISELSVLVKEIKSSGIPCANLSVAWFWIDTSEKKQVLSSLEESFATTSKEVLDNSLSTVLQMCIFNKRNRNIIALKDISQVLEGAARKIYWRDRFMLSRTLTYVGYFLSRNYAVVNCRVEQMLLSGLSALADETEPKSAVFDFDEALDIRLHAMGVAKLMYNHYIDKKKEVPESLRKWEKIAASEDEFAETRNKWSDT